MDYRDISRKRYPKLHARVAAGSKAAAVKLMCLECVGGERQEVRDCTDAGCPLFGVRPYKNAGVL